MDTGTERRAEDLPRRRREDRALARAHELEVANAQLAEFRRLVSSVRDYAIFMLDPAGVIRTWNSGARDLKGYTPEEAIGQHFSIFYTDADRERDHPADELRIAAAEGRYEEEGWRVRKDGTTFWASVTITAIHADDDDDDDEGRLTGFAKVTRDLTERRAAEDSLRSAVAALREANAELDRFASIAAHDMTDPLSTMTGFAEILERGTLPPEKVTEYAGHIRASGLRLMRMLQGLLAYARAGKSDLPSIAVDLAAATTQVIDDLAALVAERDAAVDVDLPDGAAAVTQPRDLRLVLQNLISNALKFADAGDPRVAIRGERLDGGWRISVRDNGAGIAAADTDRIFKAFERADAGDEAGYGLGLAICHRLVERLGGEIGVRSQPGAGSCFWFTLPD